MRREDERREEASRAHGHANVIGEGVLQIQRAVCSLDAVICDLEQCVNIICTLLLVNSQ